MFELAAGVFQFCVGYFRQLGVFGLSASEKKKKKKKKEEKKSLRVFCTVYTGSAKRGLL